MYKANFEDRFKILMQDFNDFLVYEDLIKLEKDPNAKLTDNDHDYYYSKINNIEFLHDFPSGISLEESFSNVKQKYDRRIKRFIKNIKTKKRVLLVWYSLYQDTDINLIKDLCQQYCKKLNKQIEFLIIKNLDKYKDSEEILFSKIDNNIFLYEGYFRDEKDPVAGNYIQCEKVFKNIKLKNKLKYIENIFSIKNEYSNNKKHKVFTFLGIKFKFKIS